MHRPDLRELDRRAVHASLDEIAHIRPADLDLPTPCAGWTLRRLLAHLAAQHRGFAAAAAGEGADMTVWEERPTHDPVAAYAESAQQVVDAFAHNADRPGDWALPVIADGFEISGDQAVSFHFVDYVVHTWDLARTLGRRVTFDGDVLGAALAVARGVPDGDGRLAEGAAFAPGLPVPDGTSALDEVLLRLGRDPSWAPTTGA